MRFRLALMIAVLALGAAACEDEAGAPEAITLIAHDSFADSAEGVFDGFTEETGVEVEVLAAGDAGSMVNQLALTRENPLADVAFGIDDNFLSRAVNEGVLAPYTSPELDAIAPGLVPESALATPIDFGDVCLNYDKGWFEGSGLAAPGSLDDLRSPEYAELLVVQDPATSSPGLAFLLSTIEKYGEDGWRDFWADLRDGGVSVASDWTSAYYGNFTRYGGDDPLVVSYASSPPAEVIFAEEPLEEAPTAVIEDGCYRQVEYAAVLEGTEHPETAGMLIDYMLGRDFQELIPGTWFVFPVRSDANLPAEFVEHTEVPESPARLSSDEIAENRDRWISEWLEVMES